MSLYLSAKHAAAYLDVPYRTFDKWVRREGIPHVWVGRQRRFSKATLDAVLKTIALRRGSHAHA
jgi:excisionase family DNA binding protein